MLPQASSRGPSHGTLGPRPTFKLPGPRPLPASCLAKIEGPGASSGSEPGADAAAAAGRVKLAASPLFQLATGKPSGRPGQPSRPRPGNARSTRRKPARAARALDAVDVPEQQRPASPSPPAPPAAELTSKSRPESAGEGQDGPGSGGR